jgi:hypothetical protein
MREEKKKVLGFLSSLSPQSCGMGKKKPMAFLRLCADKAALEKKKKN